MAGMAFLETPERVLKRVQQLEDVELPSLPSFSHEVDFESEYDESERSDKSGMVIGDEDMVRPPNSRLMHGHNERAHAYTLCRTPRHRIQNVNSPKHQKSHLATLRHQQTFHTPHWIYQMPARMTIRRQGLQSLPLP
jgi:hypothetical protein